MSDQPIVFLDTETDGVHPGRRVWEVAMIRRDGTGGEDEVSFYVEIDLATADPFGLKIGRFYDRHPVGRWLSSQGGPIDFPQPRSVHQGGVSSRDLLSRSAAAQLVAQWTHGATIIGMCPNFDTECLSWMLAEHQLTPSWHYSLVDVETMAAGYLRLVEKANMQKAQDVDPDVKFGPSVAALPFDSDQITKALGVAPPTTEERHTALGDARWCARLYDAVMEE